MRSLLLWGNPAARSQESSKGEVLSRGNHKGSAVSQKYVAAVLENCIPTEEPEGLLLNSEGVRVPRVLPESHWSRCEKNSRRKVRRKSIKTLQYLKSNSEEESFCRLLPGDELRDQLSSHHAIYWRINLLDSLLSPVGNPSCELLYQYARSCCWPEADWSLSEAEKAPLVLEAWVSVDQPFYLLPVVARLPIHHCASFLRIASSTKILVILWDLLFLEGTSVLLKAIIILIDEI